MMPVSTRMRRRADGISLRPLVKSSGGIGISALATWLPRSPADRSGRNAPVIVAGVVRRIWSGAAPHA
jgi:hypothetical protein